ncbi:hypothetical protein [Streptomyces olivaceoviridis]|uniref:hypothetical protein n=1 Tax=Streptomyces olivaceoviridis TaxID=1921 RepID=UPI0036F81D5C
MRLTGLVGNLAEQATATGKVASVIAFLAGPLSVAVNGDTVITSGGAKGPISY